jgi:hypothetical protein
MRRLWWWVKFHGLALVAGLWHPLSWRRYRVFQDMRTGRVWLQKRGRIVVSPEAVFFDMTGPVRGLPPQT